MDGMLAYKVSIKLDETSIDETIHISNSCLISSMIPYILSMLEKTKINNNDIIIGVSVIETLHAVNKRKAEMSINKAEDKKKDNKKDEVYGGLQMPTISCKDPA